MEEISLSPLSFCLALILIHGSLKADEQTANAKMNTAVIRYHKGTISIDEFVLELRGSHDVVSDHKHKEYWENTFQRAVSTRFALSQPMPNDYIVFLVSELRNMNVRQPFGPGKIDLFYADSSIDAMKMAGIHIPWDRYSAARKLVDVGTYALPILKQYRTDDTLTKVLIEPKMDGLYGLVTVGQCVELIIEEIQATSSGPRSDESNAKRLDSRNPIKNVEIRPIGDVNDFIKNYYRKSTVMGTTGVLSDNSAEQEKR